MIEIWLFQRRSLFFVCLMACAFMSSSALAFERTQTCYTVEDGRTPTCEKGQTPVPIRWENGCTTWRHHEAFPEEFLDAVKASFTTWNEVTGSYFRAHYAGSTEQFGAAYDCKIGKAGNENVVSYVTDWPSSVAGDDVVALTSVVFTTDEGLILDADIRMNADHFHWEEITKVSYDFKRVDVQNIMTHEVGHFLGLDHSQDRSYQGKAVATDATMWALTYPNEIKRRVLDEDDKTGVRTIYPEADAPDTACAPPSSIDHTALPKGFTPGRHICRSKRGCNASSGGTSAPWTLLWITGVLLASLRLRPRPER